MKKWLEQLKQLRLAFLYHQKWLENNLTESKESYRQSVINIIESCDNEEIRRTLATDVYFHDKNVNATMLHKYAPNKNNNRKFNPQEYIVTFEDCGHQIRFEVKSRTNMKYNKYGFGEPDVSYLSCTICREQRISEQKLSHKQAKLEQEKKLNALKTMPYSEYLQTDHWIETRKRAMRRARYKCELCDANGTLHVHHKTYERRGEEYNSDLIVLCSTCHAKFHDKLEME